MIVDILCFRFGLDMVVVMVDIWFGIYNLHFLVMFIIYNRSSDKLYQKIWHQNQVEYFPEYI